MSITAINDFMILGGAVMIRALVATSAQMVTLASTFEELPLDALGDPTTLASRLEEELDANKAFASFVALIGVFARKRAR